MVGAAMPLPLHNAKGGIAEGQVIVIWGALGS